jgi:hypothetical protein
MTFHKYTYSHAVVKLFVEEKEHGSDVDVNVPSEAA